jgi:osmotically-inducible protein OsmY
MQVKGALRPAAWAVFAATAVLAGCGDRIENTEMPQPQQANVEINRQGMEGAKDAEAAIGVDNKGPDTSAMGAGRDVSDPDERIASEVRSALAADPMFGSTKVDVHSDDGMVTLRGRAPDPQARERANELARNIRDVKSVDNQLTLG